jgi:hypothetical protein
MPVLAIDNSRPCDADRTEVRRAMSILFAPGDRHELRALPGGACRVAEGDDLDAAADAAMSLSDRQVYYSLNPIKADATRANKTTVTHRRWFLIDIDTIRPKDVSATDAEKAAGYDVAAKITGHLLDRGWPAPLIVDSGNGWHLLYRVNLPNEKLTQEILKAALGGLAREFDGPAAVVDTATHDAPRISKLPGTYARKGPDMSDRPHRMARIVYEPDRLDIVTIEQIRSIGSPAGDSTASGHPSGFGVVASDGTGKSAWVRSAIERECYRVLIASERNIALNTASFKLGQLADWPEMNEAEARAALKQAADRSGLDRDPNCGPSGILKTIDSGWEAGRKEPRLRPVEPAASGKPHIAMPSQLVIGLDEIVPEEVDWFWENRIAPGFISLLAGRTGMGKSFATCDYVARMSRGEPAAFSELGHKPMHTLFISEDPPNVMLGPRLLALKANTSRVKFMRFEAMSIWTLADLKTLEAAWMASGKPQQIVIDPPSNFLGEIDEHKNSALRGLLMPLVAWLDKHRVACIMITHLNKQVGKGIDAVGRIMGSVAWASTARVTLAFDKDPDNPGQNLMGGSKNNLGPLADTLAFKIVKTDSLARIEWVGKTDIGADDMVNQVPKKSKGLNATEWLIGIFRQRREWESDEIRRMAKENGISKYALFESPEVLALPITKRKRMSANGDSYWVWIANENWPSESSESRNLGAVDPVKTRESKIPKEDPEGGRGEINRIFTPY